MALDSPLRFIEALIEYISLEAPGFTVQTIKFEGFPSFELKLFLKINLYGYLNGLRSSRKLEKECVRNIELQWLLEDIRPNYQNIFDFRKQNPAVLRKQQMLSGKRTTLPQTAGDQKLVPNLVREAHFWRHQADMGLQPHQLNGIGKSKWRIQFDYDGLQYQTLDKYSGNNRFNCQTQKIELTLQGKNLVYVKNGIYKATYNSQFLS